MDSTLITPPPLNLNPRNQTEPVIFDATHLDKHSFLPQQFVWPHEDLALPAQGDLSDPPLDLKGYFDNDRESIAFLADQIRTACLSHGFFQVINHGIHEGLVRAMYEQMDAFFKLPLSRKIKVKRKVGGFCGYSGAHSDRYSSKLPWKETFSFVYKHEDEQGLDVISYINSVLGQEFSESGFVYQEYCEAMKNLALIIFELLAMSLDVERLYYRRFFEDGFSIMRGNNYPSCKEAGLTFGTGPHSDPNSLTILHQDQVGGLEIFADGKWLAIKPRRDAFVVNIGDTFMALCNGQYKSCLHRAVVNKERVRRSLVFFVNPKEDKTIKPPRDLLLGSEDSRQYPDFTCSDLIEFTQNHYRADSSTLQNFVSWLHSDKKLYI